jgi:3D (Asp-Asp-Asp) domain-containing protein
MIAGAFLAVMATAYCDRGHTASGAIAGPGTIAVDNRFIPMGTRLYVPGYGFGRAADRGGAIRGRRIDVWMSSCKAARDWGVRRLFVKVNP